MSLININSLNNGLIQSVSIGADTVELFKENTSYNVRRFAKFRDETKRVQEYWTRFETFKDAQKAFNRQLNIAKVLNKGV